MTERIGNKSICSAPTKINRKSPANAKGNAQQQCMFESPVRPKFKLAHPSNDVSFTLARGRQRAQKISLSRIGLESQIFLTPSRLAPGDLFQIYKKSFTDPETRVFQAADGENLVILACTVFD